MKTLRTAGLILASLAAAGLAVFGVLHIRMRSQATEAATSLGSPPDLTRRSPLLGRMISDALARIKKDPSDNQAYADLGRLYQANSYLREAETVWRLLRSRDPKEARWSYYLAAVRQTYGDYDETLALLEETSRRAPTYAPVWHQLAGMAFKSGKSDLALTYYKKRLELLPGDPYASVGIARIDLQQGRTAEARALLETVVRDHPKFPTGHTLYGEVLAAQGDADGATRERALGRAAGRYREAADPWLDDLRWDCHDFERLLTLATIEFQTDRGDVGIKLIQHALEVDPEKASGYSLLGKLNLKAGKIDEARDAFERALTKTKAGPPDPMSFVNLSQVYRTLNRKADTLRVVEQGLALYPDSYLLHDAHGEALGDAGRYDEAVESFKRAIELSPKDGNSHFNLALAYINLKRDAEAMRELEMTLEVHPNFVPTLTLLARRFLNLGDLETTGRYLLPLIELNPSNPEARHLSALWHAKLGGKAERTGDTSGAESHYRASVDAGMEGCDAGARLGTLLLGSNRVAEAVDVLAAYQKINDTHLEGAMLLGQAYARSGRFAEARETMAKAGKLAEKNGNKEAAKFCREIVEQLGH